MTARRSRRLRRAWNLIRRRGRHCLPPSDLELPWRCVTRRFLAVWAPAWRGGR